MDINSRTKLTAILAEYPWLPDELIKLDGRIGIIKTPMGKMMIRNMTVADAVKKTGVSEKELLGKLEEIIKRHGKK